MPSPPRLTAVPAEILVGIASLLTLDDLKSLRLSCKYVEAALFRTFAWDYFREVQVMRLEASLQALIDLSGSRLASYVKRLSLSSEVLSSYNQMLCPRYSHDKAEAEIEAYQGFFLHSVDQESFMATGRDGEMLTEALKKLAPEVVGIRDWHQSKPGRNRHSTAHNRPRRLQSLGSAKFLTAAGITEAERAKWANGDHHGAENVRCLQTLLYALGRAKSRPKRLEVIIDAHGAMPGKALRIPPFMAPVVLPVIAKLEDLHLQMNGDRERFDKDMTYSIRALLSHGERLKSLSFDFEHLLDHYEGFFDWFAASPLSPADGSDGPEGKRPPPVALPQLRHLELAGAIVSMPTALSVVRKFSPTLQSLSLMRISLVEESMSGESDTHQREVTPTKDFIQALVPLSRNWKSIRFSNLSDGMRESFGGLAMYKVFNIATAGGDQYMTFSYSGPEVPKALRGLALSMDPAAAPWTPDLQGRWEATEPHGQPRRSDSGQPDEGENDSLEEEDYYDPWVALWEGTMYDMATNGGGSGWIEYDGLELAI